MNGNYGPQTGGLPNGSGFGMRMPSGSRAPPNGSSTSLGQPPSQSSSSMTRADKFDDEMRRIRESCFAKKDETGAFFEQYITHIRVTEDAQYPQTPAPPESNPSNKKDRVVIVSVRQAGRVRIHKARENANHTFSIGKTWNMDDLTAVTSYTDYQPTHESELLWSQWAGDTGFTVKIQKNYYWQANTLKEKEYFVGSLVKIYKKYTKGRLPDLIGFSPRQEQQILEPLNTARTTTGTTSGSSSIMRPDASTTSLLGPVPTLPDLELSRTISRPSTSTSDRPSFERQRAGSNAAQPSPAGPLGARTGWQQQQMRDNVSQQGGTKFGFNQDRLTPQSSRVDVSAPRTSTPDSGRGSQGRRPSHDRTVGASESLQNATAHNSSGLGISGSTLNRWAPDAQLTNQSQPRSESPQAPSKLDSSALPPPIATREFAQDPPKAPLPERRRPFMSKTLSQESQPGIGSRGSQQDVNAGTAAAAAALAGTAAMPGGFVESPAPSEHLERNGFIPPPLQPNAKKISEPVVDERKPSLESNKVTAGQVEQDQVAAEAAAKAEAAAAEEALRPGLGRMFGANKKTMKELIQKASATHNAFVPRAGGAGARFKQAQNGIDDEADGISGVFKPALKRSATEGSTMADDSSIQHTPVSATGDQKLPLVQDSREAVPEVTVSSPIHSPEINLPTVQSTISPQSIVPAPDRQRSPSLSVPGSETVPAVAESPKPVQEAAAPKRRQRNAQQMKYLTDLGVDPGLFEGRGLEFEEVFDELGGYSAFKDKGLEPMRMNIEREVNRLEAGNWVSHLDHRDDKVDAVEKLLDKAIAEVDDFMGLLSLYQVELDSLGDDIAYIEAQSQGLQVQTANQKLLHSELSRLVDTISISPRQLAPLKQAYPDTTDGLHSIEETLLVLYRAMVTIDPNMRNAGRDQALLTPIGHSELSSMNALQDKRSQYLNESLLFIDRMRSFFESQFSIALSQTKEVLNRKKQSGNSLIKLRGEDYDAGRQALWRYHPLLLYTRDVDRPSWEVIIQSYQAKARPIYQEAFRDNVQGWKKMARKPTGEEQEILFTYSEKEPESLSTSARKLTVKRSQTLAKTLRAASNDKVTTRSSSGAGQGGLWGYNVFQEALDGMTPLIFAEQNFIVDFFHATSTSVQDFADAVATAPPEHRRCGDLTIRRMFEPDQTMRTRVREGMENMFSFYVDELTTLFAWVIEADAMQGIGVLHALQTTLRTLEDTNQDFLLRSLTTISNRLSGLWNGFINDQIRAIEETKVKIKKRKGVIAFMKVFPQFSAAIENMMPSATDEPAELSAMRSMVDKAYERINKAMFESLRVIAKESPAAGLAQAQGNVPPHLAQLSGDPEDKEALNYHILLIENMSHYAEEVDDKGDVVLGEGRRMAREEMEEHLGLYVRAVVRRPLGKVIDTIENLDRSLAQLPPGIPASTLSTKPNTSATNFRKTFASHDAKTLRKSIDELRRRVEKHFGESGDGTESSRELVGKVWKACEVQCCHVVQDVERLYRDVYDGEGVNVGLGWVDEREVERMFRGGRS